MGSTTTLHDNRRPRKGDPITYRGVHVGHVSSVDGNMCYVDPLPEHTGKYPKGAGFIWRFQNGLNELHSWPGKPERGFGDADYYAQFDHPGSRGPELSDCVGGETDCT